MPCFGCKSILTQALVIVLIGAAVGVADSRLRPVKLDRTIAPPPGPGGGQEIIPPPPGPGNGVSPPTGQAPQTQGGFKFIDEKDLLPGQITVAIAKTLYDRQAVFVDARKADKYAAGHVKGAFRISEEDFRSGDPAILAVIPRTATLVVYCSGGHCDESEQVARLLDGSGYKTIYVLHDGFPGWQAMGYPSETGEGLQ